MHVLIEQQTDEVAGGLTWQEIGVGLSMISLGVAIAATGGLAGIGVGVIVGAGFASDLAIAGVALGLAGGGGAMIGSGIGN